GPSGGGARGARGGAREVSGARRGAREVSGARGGAEARGAPGGSKKRRRGERPSGGAPAARSADALSGRARTGGRGPTKKTNPRAELEDLSRERGRVTLRSPCRIRLRPSRPPDRR